MTLSHLHQSIATPGVYELLQALDEATDATSEDDLFTLMAGKGLENPQHTFEELLSTNILQRLGIHFMLSKLGTRTYLLLEALNGGDLRVAYDRLTKLDSTLQTYELIREEMTGVFLENVSARPDFARLFVCSPWISLNKRRVGLLTHAVLSAQATGIQPELLILTRPDSDGNVPQGVVPLQNLGATVFLNSRLHSKLYIREPSRRGGYAMAIVGSQNLTKSHYFELGIRINSDGAMVDRLIAYFFELSHHSKEV